MKFVVALIMDNSMSEVSICETWSEALFNANNLVLGKNKDLDAEETYHILDKSGQFDGQDWSVGIATVG